MIETRSQPHTTQPKRDRAQFLVANTGVCCLVQVREVFSDCLLAWLIEAARDGRAKSEISMTRGILVPAVREVHGSVRELPLLDS
jgi:hypothetical protein